MNWLKLPKWSDYDERPDITKLESAKQQHQTNASLPNNEEDALLILRAEDGAMNRQDDEINRRRN